MDNFKKQLKVLGCNDMQQSPLVKHPVRTMFAIRKQVVQ